jgi:hypothetical protein
MPKILMPTVAGLAAAVIFSLRMLHDADDSRIFDETEDREFPFLDGFDFQPALFRPDRYGAVAFLETIPSKFSLTACWNISCPSEALSRACTRNCFGNSGLNDGPSTRRPPCAFRHIRTKAAPDTST